MLEYGIKTITTNPTLITKSKEIIRLVDSRNNETRAYVVPVSFEPLIEKLAKEIEFRKWVNEKKRLVDALPFEDRVDEDLMRVGFESIEEYLEK